MSDVTRWRTKAAQAKKAAAWGIRLGIGVAALSMLATRFGVMVTDEATAARAGIVGIAIGVAIALAGLGLRLAAWRWRVRAEEAESDDKGRARLRATYPDADDATIDRILGED